jgi:hypothetical protein
VNPNPDQYGAPDTWRFMQTNSMSHAPANYSLYRNYVQSFGSIPGLEAWTNGAFPEVSINTSGSTITANGANLPAGAVFAHPATGNFSVESDGDGVGGNVEHAAAADEFRRYLFLRGFGHRMHAAKELCEPKTPP